jgi:hypothetical protein
MVRQLTADHFFAENPPSETQQGKTTTKIQNPQGKSNELIPASQKKAFHTKDKTMRLAMKMTEKGCSARKDGILYVLARSITAENVSTFANGEAEYMITSGLKTHPAGFIVEPVTSEYDLVEHTGFECAGSMCCTTARTTHTFSWITPGRIQNLVHVADNVNAGTTWNIAQTKLQPGKVYVKHGEQRAAGIPEMTPEILARHADTVAWRKKYHGPQTISAA